MNSNSRKRRAANITKRQDHNLPIIQLAGLWVAYKLGRLINFIITIGIWLIVLAALYVSMPRLWEQLAAGFNNLWDIVLNTYDI